MLAYLVKLNRVRRDLVRGQIVTAGNGRCHMFVVLSANVTIIGVESSFSLTSRIMREQPTAHATSAATQNNLKIKERVNYKKLLSQKKERKFKIKMEC